MLRTNKCADERSSHQIIISLQNVRKIMLEAAAQLDNEIQYWILFCDMI